MNKEQNTATCVSAGSAHKPVPMDSLMRLPAVLQTVQGGRTWWLELVKAGKAPASVKIGRATFWQASELQNWIADRVRESRGAR